MFLVLLEGLFMMFLVLKFVGFDQRGIGYVFDPAATGTYMVILD